MKREETDNTSTCVYMHALAKVVHFEFSGYVYVMARSSTHTGQEYLAPVSGQTFLQSLKANFPLIRLKFAFISRVHAISHCKTNVESHSL